ncbi:MAG TPA: serpin family protein, partial [Clostridia bacterium]
DYVLLKKYITNPVQQTNEEVFKANTNFAFDIFKELNKEDKDKNVTISPLSISTAISMVYQGAGTTTKDAIANALRYKGLDIATVDKSYKDLLGYLNQADPKVSLNINNSIWYREGLKVKDDFLSVNKDVFNANIASLDFSKPDSTDKINGWISDATKGKIPSMIEPPISSDALMYLVNAVYFKGQWTNVFEQNNSIAGYFTNSKNERKNVVYMKKRESGEFGSGNDYKAIRLPYGDGNIAMYCILPSEGVSVNDFINTLDSSKWNTIKQSIRKSQDLDLTLPRFKVEYGTKSLVESLGTMGMGEAFKPSADFSGITPGLSISDVFHKSIVEVNEKGTEASAVTVVMATPSVILPSKDVFSAPRPFVYVIADDKTGTVLFMGKASDIAEQDMGMISIDDKYNGRTIQLSKGQSIRIGLPNNGTTAYVWSYLQMPDQKVLKCGKEYCIVSSDVPGAGGTNYWEYQSVDSGSTTIKLQFTRPGDEVPPRVFSLNVEVK